MPDIDEGLDRLIWCDLETTGLNADSEVILEVGFRITDLKLDTIDDLQVVLWHEPEYPQYWELANEYVVQMHLDNGLYEECQRMGSPPADAEDRIETFLQGYGVLGGREPLCGSSVHFDRAFLNFNWKATDERFSYRIIDVSSIKELCRRYSPTTYSNLDFVAPQKKKHRVLDDLDDTINEFKYYRDFFMDIEVSKLYLP